MGLFRKGGFFNDLTSTINPFDDKNGAFQGSDGQVAVNPAAAGPDLSQQYFGNYGMGVNVGGAGGAGGEISGQNGPGAQMMQQADSMGNFYSGQLQQAADANYATGQAANNALQGVANNSGVAGAQQADALSQIGDLSAQSGANQSGLLSSLGSTYGSMNTGAGGNALAYGLGQAQGLTNQGQLATGYGMNAANAAGLGAQQLGTAGQSLYMSGAMAQGQDISGRQQDALMGLERTEGPSSAQAQLQQATNRNMSNALALSRSGRGFGGNTTALRQATASQAQIGQDAALQSAQLRAQENAAWRQRQASNISQAGQLATSQAAARNARESSLYGLGLQGMDQGVSQQIAAGGLGLSGLSTGGQLMSQGAQTGQNAYGQQLSAIGQAGQTQLAAQQAAAQTQLAGYGQQLAAQQAAAGTQLAGYGQQGALLGQGGALELQGNAQAGNATTNAANTAMNSLNMQNQMYNQGLGWEQQHTQNELTAAGINAGIGLQQQNMGNQMTGAFLGAGGSMLSMVPMLAMSDRDTKKGIEPTNVMLDTGSGDSGQIVMPKAGTAEVVEPAYDPYSFGTGISGPNQAQGYASMDAAEAASAQAPQAQAIANKNAPQLAKSGDAKKYGIGEQGATPFSVLGKTMQQGATSAMGDIGVNPATGQSWYAVPQQTFMPSPMASTNPMMMSDEREKKALDAIDAAPGYSYDYKDPDAMGATNGRQYGVMAQDLEKTPAGRSVVHEVGGRKMVDTSRLTMVNTAAMNALSDRLAQLEKRLGGGKRAA